MTAPAHLVDPLDEPARLLAAAWMDVAGWNAIAPRAAEVEPRYRDSPQLLALCRAFEAVMQSLYYRANAALANPIAEALAHARQVGWPRAIRLAEAAQGMVDVHRPEFRAASIQRLQAHGTPEDDGRPIAERIWTDNALCMLAAADGDYAGALRHGLRGSTLAQASGSDFLVTMVGMSLSFVFLSVGDTEGATVVLARVLEAGPRWHRSGVVGGGATYNQLLCHVLAGRVDEAARLLDSEQQQFLLSADNPFLSRHRGCLAARIWMDSGRKELALQTLDALPEATGAPQHAMGANACWLEAGVRLANGQAERARALLEAGLQQAELGALVLSPLNRTQMERTLSECCEALGDLPGALAALKRSQLSSFSWVADSVNSRLQAMHLDSGAIDPARHDRRLQGVEEAVRLARDEHGRDTTAKQVRYLAHVTHEMRNPLNGVIGMTSLLALSDLNERQRRYLGLAQSSAQMLLSLCNDVLDLAKIESGRFELNPQPLDLKAMFSETVETFAPQVRISGVALELRLDPALPECLRVDRLRLQQVLMNLIGNAVKFTRRGSIRVVVQWRDARQDTGRLHVAVVDTGPGLSADKRARLFQEFSQADASVAETHGGTGLGLALCRSLLTLMDGHIDVDSEPGQGSTFWFEIPLQRVTEDCDSLIV